MPQTIFLLSGAPTAPAPGAALIAGVGGGGGGGGGTWSLMARTVVGPMTAVPGCSGEQAHDDASPIHPECRGVLLAWLDDLFGPRIRSASGDGGRSGRQHRTNDSLGAHWTQIEWQFVLENCLDKTPLRNLTQLNFDQLIGLEVGGPEMA